VRRLLGTAQGSRQGLATKPKRPARVDVTVALYCRRVRHGSAPDAIDAVPEGSATELIDREPTAPVATGPGLAGDVPDVAVLRWPADARRRDDLVRCGLARLLVVAPGDVPPVPVDGLEDWTREGVDPVDVFVRKEWLRRRQAVRAPAVLDDDGLLRRGSRWVALTDREAPAAATLLARPGTLVGRDELQGVAYPGMATDEHRRLDTLMRRLHRRIVPLGLAIHCVRAAGFLLEVGDLPA
jgi:hypothetical protein